MRLRHLLSRITRPADRAFGQLLFLTPLLRCYYRQIIGALVALLVSTAAILLVGSSIRWLADTGLKSGNSARLDYGLLLILPVVGIVAVASAARSYYIHWLGERIAADLRCKLFNHLLTLDARFFGTHRTGELVSRICTDTALVQSVVGSTTSVALRNLFMIVGGFSMMMITSIKLTAFTLAISSFVVFPSAIIGRKVKSLSRQSQSEIGRVSAYAHETLSSVQTIQAYGHESFDRVAFKEIVESAFRVAADRIKSRSFLIALIVFFAFAVFATILLVGIYDASDGRITGGELSAFVFYGALVASSMGTITEYMTELRRVSSIIGHFRELLLIKPNIIIAPQPCQLPYPARGMVCFDNVTFAFWSRPEVYALDALSFAVSPGEKVAIVGPIGAGKSTVFQLLLRFYDPQRGRIDFDGIDVRSVDPTDLRARIGVVSQEPTIFAADAWENIRFGCPTASNEDVRNAAKSVGALEFLERLPRGLATYLGEGGARLSGGQRQLIALARAILRDPAVLLLDEATNALDAENDEHVREALARVTAGRTALIVAHRLATVRKCDRIIVLNEGRKIDEGKHDKLMESCELYQRLASLEFGGALPSETQCLFMRAKPLGKGNGIGSISSIEDAKVQDDTRESNSSGLATW